MTRTRLVVILSLLLSPAACYDVDYPATYRCSAAEDECPEGLVCRDNRCVPAGSTDDAGIDIVPAIDQGTDHGPDVGAPDGPPTDGPADDIAADGPVQDLPVSDLPVSDLPLSDGPVSDLPASDAQPDIVAPDLSGQDIHPADALPIDSGVPGPWIAINVTLPGAMPFSMGSPMAEDCRDSVAEVPHPVILTHSYQISTTEVTQAQFSSLAGYNKSNNKSCTQCPINNVSWHDAVTYCNALSALAGLAECYTNQVTNKPCSGGCSADEDCINGFCTRFAPAAAYAGNQIYTCPGYRLPTEAEWEYAYRAGTTTQFYNGGIFSTACAECQTVLMTVGAIAWYCANTPTSPPPLSSQQVAQKTSNSWGLYDMPGNVAEWVHDWYGTYPTTSQTDPSGPVAGSEKVLRGGSYASKPGELRAASRAKEQPTFSNPTTGFRCVRSL